MIPILDRAAIEQLRRDHYMLQQELGRIRGLLRSFDQQVIDASIGNVATTQSVIPARQGATPGGPVTVTRYEKPVSSGDLQVKDQVEVYSWVQTDSANPAILPGGELWIFIEKDPAGVWWFVGQDCTTPPISETCADLSADTVIDTTLTGLPGTTITLPADELSYGWYDYDLYALLRVVDVPGNQTWNVSLGIYDLTDAAWLKAWDFAGQGSPLNDIDLARNFAFEVDAANAGHQIALGAVRATTTGTVTAIQQDSFGNPATGHCIRGPR